jgi:hypothetical protein
MMMVGNTDKNNILPISTALQARVMLFQPSKKPRKETRVFETKYGICKVVGRLGQQHADVLEAIMTTYKAKRTNANKIEVLIDPYKVRKLLSDAVYSTSTLKHILEDMITTLIEIKAKHHKGSEFLIMGAMVSSVKVIQKNEKDNLGNNKTEWLITFGEALCELIDKDLHLYYETQPINKLKSGITQAIIRFLLTHKDVPNGGWTLDYCIKSVAGECTAVKMAEYRQAVRKEVEGIKNCGFDFENDRFVTV